MTFSINGKVLSYLITLSFLSVLFAFIASVLGPSWFIGFILVFSLLPLFLYLYREKNLPVLYPVKCLSPCSGKVFSITSNEKQTEIVFLCGFFDLYQKKSPINGIVTNIVRYDFKNKENPGGVFIEIEGKDGSVSLEFFHKTSARPKIELFVEKGQNITQGENLCFVEFGSTVKLIMLFEADCLLQKESEVVCGVHTLVR